MTDALDPRYDFGTKGCVRGDPFRWVIKVKAKDSGGTPHPVDLSAYGTWTADARLTPNGATMHPLGVALADADGTKDSFILTLAAADTLAMNKSTWRFDLQASTGPETTFQGAIQIFPDYTYVTP